jgi:hypothetical protein
MADHFFSNTCNRVKTEKSEREVYAKGFTFFRTPFSADFLGEDLAVIFLVLRQKLKFGSTSPQM